MKDNRIYTIGQGSRKVGELIDLLINYEICMLVDVRSSPYSKFNTDFNRGELAQFLSNKDIAYAYLGDYIGGRPSDTRYYDARGRVNYDDLSNSRRYIHGIEKLHELIEDRVSICIFCSEGKPEECHRTKLIGKTMSESGTEVFHITETGETCNQAEALFKVDGGQLALFGEKHLTSRKSYR